MVSCLHVQAADSDWIFNVYESSTSSDLGTFQTTANANLFKLRNISIPNSGSGFHFMIRKSDWTGYGWGTETVAETGVAYCVAAATSASGWSTLPAGTYDITFNLSNLTIRFDVHSDKYKVSILGDSYSTFDGYITEGNESWYSSSTTTYYADNDVQAVTQTWWNKFFTANSGTYELLVNNSYSGSTMCNYTISPMAEGTSFISRSSNLSSGGTQPDVILIFGGTNDWWNKGLVIGDYQYSDWTDADKRLFRPGFAYLINNVKTTYPDTEVWFILNDMITDDVYNSICTICNHYSIPIIAPQGIAKGSGHPTEVGMTTIKEAVEDALVDGNYVTQKNNWVFYESIGYTTKNFTLSDYNPYVYAIDEYTAPSNAFKAYIGNSSWTEGFYCGTSSTPYITMTALGTYYCKQTTTSAAQYITAMTADTKYRLVWDEIRHTLSLENGEDEGETWYLKAGDEYMKLMAIDTEEYMLFNYTPTLDDYNGVSLLMTTSGFGTTGYGYNPIYAVGTLTLANTSGYIVDASGTWTATDYAAYCTALSPGKSYNFKWNKRTHQLTIEEYTAPTVSYTTYSDGHAKATVDGDYLRGGDISMLNYVESFGAKFKHADGTEDDPLDILQENGCNIVRLRLYNNPGQEISFTKDATSYSYKLPASYLDETDVLSLARRAKAHNMKIELTFHYSDFWTNGEMQFKPKAWESYSMDELKQAVHDYTYNFLQRMNAQGTTPDYVSLGNEIQGGLLFGYYTSGKEQLNAVNGYASNENMANVAALLNQGSSAVRSACPNAKVVIHLTLSESITEENYKWFFDAMKTNSLDYDIIGASYYPYWTNQKPSMLTSLANTMYSRYGKDLLIMEVGYSWTQYRPSGRYSGNHEGQLHMNGTAYNEATEAGQKSFMQELQTVVKGNEHILGYLYWDPVMLEQQVNSSWIKTTWALRKDGSNWWEDGNMVGNTTLFDYEGKALPVFEAIAEDAVNVPDDVTISGTSYTVEQEEPYTLTIGDTGYATFYDVQAREIPDGLTVYTVQSYTGSKLDLTEYNGPNIPSATGVLVMGDEGTYYLWPRYDGNSSVSGNMLYGTASEQTITTPMGNYYYYKLAKDKNNGLGWYWGEADGGVFTNGAHKAYLAVPQNQANARSFISLFDDGSTDISSIHNSQCIMHNECFNLQGRRVVNPTKGLYIVGGKKVVIK